MPVTSRLGWSYVAVILAFPLVCLVLGIRMMRAIRAP
jgi:hypothetical protein